MGAPWVDGQPVPPADAEGLTPAAPRGHDAPETPAGPEFDEIAALAADLLRAPSALVSIVDEHGPRLLGSIGIATAEASRIWASCGHAFTGSDGLLVVPDASADPRFAGGPLAADGTRIRFYAGAPITAPDGRALGAVCVLSPQPRPFGIAPAERRRLAALAAVAMRALENRRGARRAAEEAARSLAAEERLRFALGAAGGCAWELHPRTGQSVWDAGARDLFGMAGSLPFPEALHLFAHPDDADTVRDAVARALDPATGGGRCAAEHRGPLPGADGRPRWFRSAGRVPPAAEEDGGGSKPARVVCASVEITDQRAAGERQALIVAELHHRVKNTLTVVLALAEQSLRATGGGAETRRFHADFQARLLALSRAHDLLTREAWGETDLAGLARAALAPFGILGEDGAPARIEARGPRVLLAPEAAVSLAMALHELATNATKHGALSRPAGGVSLAWGRAADGGAALDVAWTESGGPPLDGPPARRGFGLHLLERGLARQLGGEAALNYGAAGLSFRLRVPLGDRVALG
jgi:two-component sensor histidine kinase